ncbi:MAG: hypothetical protein OSJ54_03390 [Oscillospiraceae bacterium]|nr:hypothetical protein [Oscillospiraceae bacterium]
MEGKLRNMTNIYLLRGKSILLFRKGIKVVNNVWISSVELNDAKACVLREMHEELGINHDDINYF